MIEIIRRFFAFCGEENRRKFHLSIALGVLQAFFEALKIPAIAVMVDAGEVESVDGAPIAPIADVVEGLLK